jgi:recombination protein RecR
MYPPAVQSLIDELGRLPGIGPKPAQRIVLHLLKLPAEDARRLARALDAVKERVTWCRRCFNIAEVAPLGDDAEGPLCDICSDPRRDQTTLCVVEEARDLLAIEKVGDYYGLYHVLQGAISHFDRVGPDNLRIRELLARLESGQVAEVILFTNTNVEGTFTAQYLQELLRDRPVKVTRPATGLPMGADLEYADELTLGRALAGRQELGA